MSMNRNDVAAAAAAVRDAAETLRVVHGAVSKCARTAEQSCYASDEDHDAVEATLPALEDAAAALNCAAIDAEDAAAALNAWLALPATAPGGAWWGIREEAEEVVVVEVE